MIVSTTGYLTRAQSMMILQIEISVLRTTDMLFSDVIETLNILSGVRKALHG